MEKSMTVVDFKREIDRMFPCRCGDDFLHDIREVFDEYLGKVSCLEGVESDLSDEIRELCDSLINVLRLYFDGRKGEAFSSFASIMNGNADDVAGLFSSIGSVDINPGQWYYRARQRKEGTECSIPDMFHIPLDKRRLVSPQRYSSPGYPCLYLGNSVYSCREEMRRPTFDNLMFSAYRVRNAFRVFDMRVPDDSDYDPEALPQTLRRLPMVLACGFTVQNPSDVFKSEYIIPQMLVEAIISNSRRITQKEKSLLDKDVVWGVIYTSTHIGRDFPYGKKYLENMVLPVVKTDADCTYCQYLASLFDISSPLCYEYESLKANAARTFVINVDEEESAEFTTLPHILLGCPAESGSILPEALIN